MDADKKDKLTELIHERAEEIHKKHFADGYQKGYEEGARRGIDEFFLMANESYMNDQLDGPELDRIDRVLKERLVNK